MFKLDDNLLIELGLGSLPAVEKNRMLRHIYETLEMRVGMKLAQRMTNEQLDEFEAFINRNDEAGALKWLESNFPNYKQVVADELETLKTEIKTAAPQIVAASQQQAVLQPAQPAVNAGSAGAYGASAPAPQPYQVQQPTPPSTEPILSAPQSFQQPGYAAPAPQSPAQPAYAPQVPPVQPLQPAPAQQPQAPDQPPVTAPAPAQLPTRPQYPPAPTPPPRTMY